MYLTVTYGLIENNYNSSKCVTPKFVNDHDFLGYPIISKTLCFSFSTKDLKSPYTSKSNCVFVLKIYINTILNSNESTIFS